MARRGRKRGKTPRLPKAPMGPKQPILETAPDAYKDDLLNWAISAFDVDGPWGVSALAGANWKKHLALHCKSFETMTWDEIEQNKRNNHSVDTQKLSSRAKARLKVLRLEDTDSLFSLRLEGVVRIYGIRDRATLKILWFDPWHNEASRAVYPSRQKHT